MLARAAWSPGQVTPTHYTTCGHEPGHESNVQSPELVTHSHFLSSPAPGQNQSKLKDIFDFFDSMVLKVFYKIKDDK